MKTIDEARADAIRAEVELLADRLEVRDKARQEFLCESLRTSPQIGDGRDAIVLTCRGRL